MKKILGIDLGHRTAIYGIVNQYGELENYNEVENDKDNLLSNIQKSIMADLKKWGYDYKIDIERISFDLPGFINPEQGVVRENPDFGWKDYDIKKDLEKLFKGKPIYILNDADAAALGEFWTGAGSKYNSEVFYSIGNRLGGGIVLDGKLVTGEHGFAGEFGHGGAIQDLFKCPCGLKGCLTPTVTGPGMVHCFQHEINDEKNYALAEILKKNNVDINNMTMEQISEVYKKENKPAVIKNALMKYYKPLFTHIALMMYALDPKIIILGGGVSNMKQDLVDLVNDGLKDIISDIYKEATVITTGELGENAAVVGAAYYAINDWDWTI